VRTVVHNTAQNSSDNVPSYLPDNHHSSDDVYYRGGGISTLGHAMFNWCVMFEVSGFTSSTRSRILNSSPYRRPVQRVYSRGAVCVVRRATRRLVNLFESVVPRPVVVVAARLKVTAAARRLTVRARRLRSSAWVVAVGMGRRRWLELLGGRRDADGATARVGRCWCPADKRDADDKLCWDTVDSALRFHVRVWVTLISGRHRTAAASSDDAPVTYCSNDTTA